MKRKAIPDMANLIGYLKHIIGMCMDEEKHDTIRQDLWEAVEMAYAIRNSKWNDELAAEIDKQPRQRREKLERERSRG
jgi:hypothetical protein